MMVNEKETVNGHSVGLNCSMGFKTGAENNEKGGLLLDGSSSGVSFGNGGSAEGVRMYTRKKRRKMSNSDEIMKSEFNDKMKVADGNAPVRDKHMLSFIAFNNGPGECYLRHSSGSFSEQMDQSLNGHEEGLAGCIQNTSVTYQENGCMPVIKKSFDNVERSDDQTNSSAPELSQSEASTSSELCRHALSDILNSEKFSELRGLLLKNFGVLNVNRVLDVEAISSKINNGAYETSPMLYLKDIQQVWANLQQVGNEMVTLARSLSDESRAHYEQVHRTNLQIQRAACSSFLTSLQQFVRKPRAAEPRGCQGCGEKADVRNCLVCDSCEDIYHLSCTELVGTEIPPSSWYCASCVSNGLGSPHDNCVVCEKLKSSASIPLVNGFPTIDQSQDTPNGPGEHLHDVTNDNQSSKFCFICKSEIKIGDNFRTCGHSLCPHKFYHYNCLSRKQLGVCGSCWYCPSCLCRRCLVDKDDDQIVLCDCCDEAYHIYCASPQLHSIPKGSWFCGKCSRELTRMRTMRRIYESMQKKVKTEDESEKEEHKEVMNEREGLDMLVSAVKTLSHQDSFWGTRSSIL